jgi:protocatechuate 3,4-dioxygenase alpha subunit
VNLPRTPSQTVGPYLAIGLPWPDGPFVVPEDDPDGIWIRGAVVDGAGEVVPDALVETWQADPDGRFAHPADDGGDATTFRGFGRCPTDGDGCYAIRTRKPGRVPAPDGRLQAPHVDVSVFARGLLNRLVTRIYFDDEAGANGEDPVLGSIEDPQARRTLVAQATPDGYRFDIRLRGDEETVFFDV